ncbi:subtilisin-like protease SDD1 [Carex littledalei]|uniref:Subtilisin-like protease SDD1 n=1 Tax=Carex littledalei TaxID=544730 RepID=A0A833V115_9POAL|nr:subtilisin-like protease SDD1 [Carex littledalei]
MGRQHNSFLFLFLVFTILLYNTTKAQDLRTYIIQLHPNEMDTSFYKTKLHWHLSFLEKATVLEEEEESHSARLLYSYDTAIEGFAARLNEHEAMALKSLPGVISVQMDRRYELHTTYSHKFLGLNFSPTGVWVRSKFGHGAIIGVLDTGIWPESPSFDDSGMPPVPKHWRGICQEGEGFIFSNCNRKIIGARFYSKGHRVNYPDSRDTTIPLLEYVSPRDAHGHGTHTSSTAAGSAVPGASVLGLGLGTARGVAPGAHIAVYKVCWFDGCYSSDILAGIDDAINDGVNVLSLSLGGFPTPLFEDSIAIGSFRAVERGVAVICAAGNNGPAAMSVANEAPWITTVGASTMDRRFPAIVRLGNGEMLYGESMYPGNKFSKQAEKRLDLVYESGGNQGAEYCLKGSLSRTSVQGKMVVCDRGINGRSEKGEAVREAGGAAMVLANAEINHDEDSVDVHVLPSTVIGYEEGVQLKKYINSSARPIARFIYGGTKVGRSRAPAVALFSARGPSATIPSVLKPDMIAPGVNIIAAWPVSLGPTGLQEDQRRSNFTVLSGTSMACPHVSGVAALVRSVHPEWSPAAVRSAMMTTADVADHLGKPIMDEKNKTSVFAMGAGQVNPNRSIDPGLVYDIRPEDYITHLCILGYNQVQICTITHRNTSCSGILRRNKKFNLNYPSITVNLQNLSRPVPVMVQRVLTNVGTPNSTYTVQVKSPKGVAVKVVPEKLTFLKLNDRKSFRVWFEMRKQEANDGVVDGFLVWKHSSIGRYRVRSPIAVTWTM